MNVAEVGAVFQVLTCLENVGTSASHNTVGFNSLLKG
jgi:hypothetical protein